MEQHREEAIGKLAKKYPYVIDFFDINALPDPDRTQSMAAYAEALPVSFLEDTGLNKQALLERFDSFMESMEQLRSGEHFFVESLKIKGGTDKSGNPEHAEVTVHKGEILSVVGPTGSGKSKLLSDIEWMAQGDTETGRQILINDAVPPVEWRFSTEHHLVAQLSQNMNFVMDVSVGEFLQLHTLSRMVDNKAAVKEEILENANALSGEKFSEQTPLTSLSGGQARALMVADTAVLSRSPVVLIDEIENAGIDRSKALELLVGKNKIVIAATHDPILALIADKRVVIKNGGIYRVSTTTKEEKTLLAQLLEADTRVKNLREKLRRGESLSAQE